jgi:hypothetical protein
MPHSVVYENSFVASSAFILSHNICLNIFIVCDVAGVASVEVRAIIYLWKLHFVVGAWNIRGF